MEALIPPDEALATLTHARLRAAQGDYGEARDLLRRFLDRHPESLPARRLLQSLEVAGTTKAGAERKPSDAAVRIARLHAWLVRIRRNL